MTPIRYRECLTTLGLSQRGLAPILGCSTRLTHEWAIGSETVPPLIAEWLEAWVAHRRAHPDPLPPLNWRRRCPGLTLKPCPERAPLPLVPARP